MVCTECPAGYYQPQEREPSANCTECPLGWEGLKNANGAELKGSATCRDLGALTPADCSPKEYLNDQDVDATLWTCDPCPEGGFCEDPITFEEIRAKFGFARCPSRDGTPP